MNLKEIVKKYKNGEASVEDTNKALDEIDAGFHFEWLTPEERAEKKRREDEAGLVPNPDWKPQHINRKPNMKRITALAGRDDIIQHTVIGDFKMTYDENGYAVSAKKI